MKLELLLYIQKLNSGRRGHREEERHLLLCIFVTTPVFHLDTSELNADAVLNTTKKRVQNKEKGDEDQPTKNNQKDTDSNTQQQQKTKRVRSVIR
jgi:hypothetical protein